MTVFVLEDDPERIRWFQEEFFHDDLTLREDVASAIPAFQGRQWDLVLLDHDLGGEVFVDSTEENTGAGFTRAVRDELAKNESMVIIHSYNPVGASMMQDILAERGIPAMIAPFRGPSFMALLDAARAETTA